MTVTLVDGVATFGGLSYDKAETIDLSFTDNMRRGSAIASNNIAVSPNSATQLVFEQQPTNGTAGVAIGPAITVEIEDAYGNVETGDIASNLSLAVATGPGNVTSGNTATVSAGVATFAAVYLDTAGDYTLDATDSAASLTSAPSNGFVVSPSTATQLVFGQQPTGTLAGVRPRPGGDGRNRGQLRERGNGGQRVEPEHHHCQRAGGRVPGDWKHGHRDRQRRRRCLPNADLRHRRRLHAHGWRCFTQPVHVGVQ